MYINTFFDGGESHAVIVCSCWAAFARVDKGVSFYRLSHNTELCIYNVISKITWVQGYVQSGRWALNHGYRMLWWVDGDIIANKLCKWQCSKVRWCRCYTGYLDVGVWMLFRDPLARWDPVPTKWISGVIPQPNRIQRTSLKWLEYWWKH